MYRPDAVGWDFEVVELSNGGNNQSDPGVEVKSDPRTRPSAQADGLQANLDIQYTLGLTYPTPNIFYE